jgi:hypothetical protein
LELENVDDGELREFDVVIWLLVEDLLEVAESV